MFGVLTTPQCVVSTKGHRAHVAHTTGCPPRLEASGSQPDPGRGWAECHGGAPGITQDGSDPHPTLPKATLVLGPPQPFRH